MRRFQLSGVVLAAVFTTATVTLWPRPALAILGGELDGNQHPNVGTFVQIRTNDPSLTVPRVRGSGVLIHPRVVATAAHLVTRIWGLREDLVFSFGTNALDPASWLEIETAIIHPKYLEWVNANTGVPTDVGLGALPDYADIALVILKEPVRGLTPASLAPEGFLDFLDGLGALGDARQGAKLTVVGYGDHGDAPDKFLPKDGLRRVAQSEFMFLQPRWLFLDQNAAHGNGGTAEGDSGGPTFWVDPETGKEILVSLTSRGDLVGVAIGISYRTDTAEALDFIDFVVAIVEAGLL